MVRLGLIGYGGIGRTICHTLMEDGESQYAIAGVMVHDKGLQRDGENFSFLFDINELLDTKPDVIAECAGHEALHAYGEAILRSGITLVAASVGALADEQLMDNLIKAATQGRSKLVLPAGAIGAMDALSAARSGGLTSVTYRARKPVHAWRGSPADLNHDLNKIKEPTKLFSGTAREAAKLYPKNANVAATVALAGLGFDATMVELVADPIISKNIHEISVCSKAGQFDIRLEGNPSPDNPKTSMLTAYSLVRVIRNMENVLVI